MADHPRCGACKILNRECNKDCIFAPHFPPEKSDDFALLHQHYNIEEILTEKFKEFEDPKLRESVVESFLWGAKERARDPVYGPMAVALELERLNDLLNENLFCAKKEFETYMLQQKLNQKHFEHGSASTVGASHSQGIPYLMTPTVPQQQNQQDFAGEGALSLEDALDAPDDIILSQIGAEEAAEENEGPKEITYKDIESID